MFKKLFKKLFGDSTPKMEVKPLDELLTEMEKLVELMSSEYTSGSDKKNAPEFCGNYLLRNGMIVRVLSGDDVGSVRVANLPSGAQTYDKAGYLPVGGKLILLAFRGSDPLTWIGGAFGKDFDVVQKLSHEVLSPALARQAVIDSGRVPPVVEQDKINLVMRKILKTKDMKLLKEQKALLGEVRVKYLLEKMK